MNYPKPSVAVWITMLLGVVLLVSPWIFGFAGQTEDRDIAIIAGVLVALASGLGLALQRRWPTGWVSFVLLNILFGGGVVISAQIFGFKGAAGWVQEIIGVAVIAVTMVELWRLTDRSVINT